MVLHIKNMVCNRCIMVVAEGLKNLGLPVTNILLGKVELLQPLQHDEKQRLKEWLTKNGFELLDDKKSKLIDEIKTLIITLVHHDKSSKPDNVRYSDFIEKEIGMEYSGLSKLFSEVEGITIEQYLINQKVEGVKELLVYDELSVSEIAFRMGYSSVAHLSSQFKRITGLTPREFKSLHEKPRKPLDMV